jgi:hypothetical protein
MINQEKLPFLLFHLAYISKMKIIVFLKKFDFNQVVVGVFFKKNRLLKFKSVAMIVNVLRV